MHREIIYRVAKGGEYHEGGYIVGIRCVHYIEQKDCMAGLCGEVRLILGSRIDASPKSTTGQEDRTEARRKPAGLAGGTYLLPVFRHSHCNL